MSSLPTTAGRLAPAPGLSWSRVLTHRITLPVVFLAAFAYHGLWSLGHRTPLVFDDEILYGKLGQSIAAGRGFEIWGHHYFFPAPLAPLVQAPMWLIFGTGSNGYLAVRLLGALIMSSAAFPAYRLAAQLVGRQWAVVAALLTVTLPSLAYHDYLTAEALAFPLFLLGVSAIVSAVAEPTRGARFLVVVACAAGVTTRLQLVVLPVAYVAAVVLCSSRRRAHLVPVAAMLLPALAAFAVRGTGAVGQYHGIFQLAASPSEILHWAYLVAILLPFSVGFAIVPGAVLALADRPRNRGEAAFVVVTLVSILGMLAQAGLIAAAEAKRPMERYAFYVGPLLVVAFLLYVRRGAPRRMAYVALAIGGGLAASRFPFHELVPAGSLYFDGTTESTLASLLQRFGPPNGTLLIELLALAVGVAAAATAPRRPSFAVAACAISMALGLAGGALYYRADHDTTSWVVDRFAGGRTTWVDRPATYLAMPGHQLIPDSTVAIWNPNIERVAQFHRDRTSQLPYVSAAIAPDGTLLVGGKPNAAGTYVLGAWASRMGIQGEVLARNGWLTEMQLPRAARIRWIAFGLMFDDTTTSVLTYRTWPKDPTIPGRFTISLSLTRVRRPKTVTAYTPGGATRIVKIPLRGHVEFTLDGPATARPMLSLSTRVTGESGDSFFNRGVRVDRIVYGPR